MTVNAAVILTIRADNAESRFLRRPSQLIPGDVWNLVLVFFQFPFRSHVSSACSLTAQNRICCSKHLVLFLIVTLVGRGVASNFSLNLQHIVLDVNMYHTTTSDAPVK
jgi:hypothetical protein